MSASSDRNDILETVSNEALYIQYSSCRGGSVASVVVALESPEISGHNNITST
jgi:hypothetical protein